LALRPDHSSVWLTRADVYGRLGLWDLAAADFRRASQLQEPGSANAMYLHALLRLYTRDVAGYRDLCDRMVQRVDNPHDPRSWQREEVARICLLAEGSPLAPGRLVALTQRAAEAGRSALRLVSLGTALYRAGRFDLAMERLQDAKATDPPWATVWADSVAAMIHHPLGRPD